MQQNRVKKILREGGLALGTHVGGIPDPQIVELIGLAGFDAAFIDMEHTTFDLHDVQAMVMAAERVGVTPIVRTPGFDPAFILRLLDMGVQGVQVPHVSSAAVAREAVKAVRYPPEGERGMAAGSRAANFGKTPLLEHMAQSNREALLACMIEDMEAVEQIEEIAAVGVTPIRSDAITIACTLCRSKVVCSMSIKAASKPARPISSTICGSGMPPTCVPSASPPSRRIFLTRFCCIALSPSCACG